MMIHISQNETTPTSRLKEGCNKTLQRFSEAFPTSIAKTCLKTSTTCKCKYINDHFIYDVNCRNPHSSYVSEKTSINIQNIIKVYCLLH